MTFDQLISRTIAIDLELTRTGNRLRHVGAVFRDATFEWKKGKGSSATPLADLDAFGREAHYILGHNIFSHDLPFLYAMAPNLEILKLPVIDTLYLSPLAFPRNPYHRLVKDYKLVRSALSDPLEDVRLALTIFRNQWESFTRQSHPIHQHLSRLDTGDRVHLTPNGTGVAVQDAAGICIARLSAEGAARWAGKLDDIAEARVLGILQWFADDGQKDYRHLARVTSWEVPIIEIAHTSDKSPVPPT